MKRTAARELAIQLSFAAAAAGREPDELLEEFFSEEHFASLAEEGELFAEKPDKRSMEYIRRVTALIAEKRDELDAVIEQYARGWRVDRLSRTALAVLRCAICEILYMEDIPAAAAINEAVELDKGYDDPDVVSFVNGVLGGFMRGERPGEPIEVPESDAEEADDMPAESFGVDAPATSADEAADPNASAEP